MSHREGDKATRYIALLDNARLNGNWSEVPELVRKVNKHAPHRQCLTNTAATEAQISSALKVRPGSEPSVVANSELQSATSRLQQVAEQERNFPGDALQASACLAQLHFLRNEWDAISRQVPGDIHEQIARLGSKEAEIPAYTRACLVKSRFCLGIAQEHRGQSEAAIETYLATFPLIESTPRETASAREYKLWAQRIIARACMLEMRDSAGYTIGQANRALILCRTWSKFWEQTPNITASGSAFPQETSTRSVWSSYYRLLSQILAADLSYTDSPTAPLSARGHTGPAQSHRVRQRAEFKRVEATYETLLLQETQFPKSSQTNTEIERWADQVMRNWQIFSGPSWRGSDLGEGGRESVSRGVLDILYRAATKTFHSTAILRHLFTVHASLAEFDLAIKAFDSYTEIIGKGRARAEKTGKHEVGIDSDDIVLLTAAEAINVSCIYGSRDQAEKALEIGKTLSLWLQQQTHSSSDLEKRANSEEVSAESFGSPSSLSAAYRAIGQSEANWARFTYEPSLRNDLQNRALGSLKRSASTGSRSNVDPETACLLAFVLAETRDVSSAVTILREAIAAATSGSRNDTLEISVRRKTPAMLHMMALALTAKTEHEAALKMCHAAQDQLMETAKSINASFSQASNASCPADVSMLEDVEKECLLQTKMTEISLIALMESPSAAAERSHELLSLYARMFGNPAEHKSLPVSTSSNTLTAPKSSSATIKSFRGSILGRPKATRKSLDTATFTPQRQSLEADTQLGPPIAITVTNEDHHPTDKRSKRLTLFRSRSYHGDSRTPEQTFPRGEQPAANGLSDHEDPPPVPEKDVGYRPTNVNAGKENSVNGVDPARTAMNTTSSPQHKFQEIPHNTEHDKQPPPLKHPNQPPAQDLRLPTPHPAASGAPSPQFPSVQQRRHSVSLLVHVWLFVATSYTRDGMLDEAKGAVDEASKLVDGFQMALASEESSARVFDERGWGSGKSVNRLWADVWAERGTLHLALGQVHEARSSLEQALSHFPDHPSAIVTLSGILLDIFEQKIPSEPPSSTSVLIAQSTSHYGPYHSHLSAPVPHATSTPLMEPIQAVPQNVPSSTAASAGTRYSEPSPRELNRLAARDRAYGLLSTLTKLGEGWDNAEAWFMLSRAYELSGQVERARECLWWVVELEDARPIRPWHCVGGGIV